MMATPKIDTKPTADEMLKCVPVRNSPQMPPTESASTFANTSRLSRNERNASYSSRKINVSDAGMISISRASAFSISSNSPLHTIR